jgi:methyltransferase (TIGR00027 family)
VAPSKTAEYVAFYRALETLEPRREPLFRDPYASLFVDGRLALELRLARVPSLYDLVTRAVDRRAPGARLAAAARTRFIDDLAERAVARGVSQLVLLGAGYDCRGHRLRGLRSIPVFEVDREAELSAKRARLGRTRLPVRTGVRYAPAVLGTDDLDRALGHAGFDGALPALIVLEGVLNYLPEANAARVLAWAGRAAKGSSVVFSYVDRAVLEGTFEGAEDVTRAVRGAREPWRSGFAPADLAAVLRGLGLVATEDLGSDAYRERHLGPQPGAARFSFYRLAVAEVR